MSVTLVALSQGAGPLAGKNAEEIIAYAARVSSPQNQANFDTAHKLLAYCIREAHWSIFETASLTMEITTSRAIAAQILRHRSFQFQEHSQRYAESHENVTVHVRRQDLKNRQNSVDDLEDETRSWFAETQDRLWSAGHEAYQQALGKGIAKECARFLLPLSTQTRLYMTGSVRSWIHYIQLRSGNGTQKEHQDLALQAKTVFCDVLPIVSRALGW
jgi:thymidylate synthase (FAD)